MDNPFTTADRLLERQDADIVLVDFHAEATSSWPWAGIWTAGWPPSGAPTPMCPPPTPKFLPKGSGHITDLGMTGLAESILGIRLNSPSTCFGGTAPPLRGGPGPMQAGGPVYH